MSNNMHYTYIVHTQVTEDVDDDV